MTISIVTYETLPKRGGVATWVDTFISEAKLQGHDIELITSSPSIYKDALYYLPDSFKSPALLTKFLQFCRGFEKRKSYLLCDAGAIIFAFFCYIFGLKNRNLTIVFHGTEIIRLTNRFKKVGLGKLFFEFVSKSKHVYISNVVKNIVYENTGLSNGFVVYNSCNIRAKNKTIKVDGESARINILIVGRLDPRKRTDKLLKSLRLVDKGVDVNIVGDGPCFSDLKLLAGQYKKSNDNVNLLGRVDDKKLEELYQASDVVFVGAGRSNNAVEGFGLTVLEALSYNKVPICINLDGPGEISSFLGLPISENNISSIAHTINKVATGFEHEISEELLSKFTPQEQVEKICRYINE